MENKYSVYLTIEQMRAVQLTLMSRLSVPGKKERLSFFGNEETMNDGWKALELITEAINEAEGEEEDNQ